MGGAARRLPGIGLLLWLALTGTTATAADSADALFAANRFAQARTAYQREIALDPRRSEPRVGLLRALFRLDLWREADGAARQWAAADPRNADAHGMLALCLMRQGLPDGAAAEARTALQLNPNSYWGAVASARVLVWNHEQQSAQSALRRAAGLHPDWPEAWYGLLEAAGDDLSEQDLADSAAYLRLAPKGHPNTAMMETLPTRMAFMRRFLHDTPYRAVTPLSEEALAAADRGQGPARSFSTAVGRQGDYVLLPAKIDGQEFRLLFDTGGGFEVTLSKSASAKLKLPLLYKSLVRGVSGSEPARLYEADEMTVGEQTLHSIPVVGIDSELGPFDGIFGVTNFDHYAVTIDFARNRLTLARGEDATAPPPAAGARTVTMPFHYLGGDIFVPVTVEGRHAWAVVDTGADATVILSLRLAREIAAGRKKNASREVSVRGRMGIGNSATRQTVVAFTDPLALTVGEADGKPFRSSVSPAYGASPLDEQVSPAGDFEVGALLGIGFLARANRVTFDYPHRILTLEYPRGTTGAGSE